jgi:methylmalonyl-CoA mutase
MEKSLSFDGFQPFTWEEWKGRVLKELGAKSFESLRTVNPEGFGIEPGYTADHAGPFLHVPEDERVFLFRNPGNQWELHADAEGSPEEVNAELLEALTGGATSVGIPAGGDQDALRRSLQGVYLNMIATELRTDAPAKTLGHFADLARELAFDSAQLRGALDFDIWSHRDAWLSLAEQHAGWPLFRFFTADGLRLRDRGASAAQEVAYALYAGNAVLEALTEQGIAADAAASMIRFRFGTGTEYFTEIARYRAFRFAWKEVVKAYSPARRESFHAHVHAVTAPSSLYQPAPPDYGSDERRTRRTTACQSHRVTSPAQSCIFRPLVAHIQHILREESSLHDAADPARGSFYLETLSAQIASSAWELFLEANNMSPGGPRVVPLADQRGKELRDRESGTA